MEITFFEDLFNLLFNFSAFNETRARRENKKLMQKFQKSHPDWKFIPEKSVWIAPDGVLYSNIILEEERLIFPIK